jgi:hypothetical protein
MWYAECKDIRREWLQTAGPYLDFYINPIEGEEYQNVPVRGGTSVAQMVRLSCFNTVGSFISLSDKGYLGGA